MNDDSNSIAADPQIRVLITRPIHQTRHFEALLREAGLQPVSLPTIEIEYVRTSTELALNSQLIIFTSVNSVNGAHENQPLPWKFRGRIAAIGDATKNALSALNTKVDLVPAGSASSEALLSIVNEPPGSIVTIVRGDRGREKLYRELIDQGLTVQYLEVYKRKLPGYSDAAVNQLLSKSTPHIVSVTSDLGLENLLEIVPKAYRAPLFACPLVVNSHRCAGIAKARGFSNTIVVADPPGDLAQVSEISRLAQTL